MDTSNYTNKGQALLIVLLAMSTLTTIALSIVSRSISQVEVTNREEESIRAFSAAEAGIEQALITGSIGDTPVSEDLNVESGPAAGSTVSTYVTEVTGFPESATEFVYPIEILSGDIATIWFVTKDGSDYLPCGGSSPCFTGSSFDICWGESGAPQTPALALTFIYEDSSGDLKSTRAAYDPDTGRRAFNHFDAHSGSCSGTIDGKSYSYRRNINLASLNLPNPDNLKYMRVRMLYNTASPQTFGVRANSGGSFPPQGKKVSSVGQSGNSTRKIEAYLLNSSMPSIFEAAMYSPVGIIKN